MRKFSINKVRESKLFKGVAAYTALNMLFQVVYPTTALALTSGPAQEEFTSFEPASTSDMVDLHSGDFTYNLPLLSVPGPNGGYPINMAYHGGVGMEQEASWVGLGWNINVGAINRQLQGLADDFNGEEIKYKMHSRDSWEASLDLDDDKMKKEHLGFPPIGSSSELWEPNVSRQVYYNNYKGLGYRLNFGMTMLSTSTLESQMGMSFDSQNGIGISIGADLKNKFSTTGIGLNYNSRNGLQGITANTGFNFGFEYNKVDGVGTKLNGSFSASSSLGFAQSASLPNLEIPTKTNTVPISIMIGNNTGIAKWQTSSVGYWDGSYTQSEVINNGEVTRNAYGYMNTQNSNDEGHLQDFSRENMILSKKNPYLAPSRYTYDVFMHTGQGTGGAFRGTKNNVSILSTPKTISESVSNRAGVEWGAPDEVGRFHVGLDYTHASGTSESGDWKELGSAVLDNEFNNVSSMPYYKVYGEHTGMLIDADANNSESKLTKWRDDEAVLVNMEKTGGWLDRDYQLTDKFSEKVIKTGPLAYLISPPPTHEVASELKEIQTTQRRGKMIRSLNVAQASMYGYYRDADFTRPGNLISEMQVTQQDGMRYIYGLPSYNNQHIQVAMSVTTGQNEDHNTNVVDLASDSYLQGGSQSREYLNRSEMPEYAHSWMLTSVLSPDYIDVDDVPGPSDGDYGYWTKFNYKKQHENYEWRIPYQGGTYIEGNPGDENDDMAFYSYGKKQIHYIQSIETKTHIAIFHTSEREDGRSANGEYATQSTAPGSDRLHKLDKIELFTKMEYYNDQGQPDPSAVALQTVHFNYNYDLCRNVPNNDGAGNNKGKLTLTKVYFTYENSNRGELSPYEFIYDNDLDNDPSTTPTSDLNPSYDQRFIDRWGNYKDNEQYTNSGDYPYINFPYTEQGTDRKGITGQLVEKESAGIWALHQVNLPTGGTFKIQYEKDDYAYVEGKKATRMFDIVGAGNVVDQGTYYYENAFYEIEYLAGIPYNISNIDGANYDYEKLSRNSGDIRLAKLTNYDDDRANGNESDPTKRIYRIYFNLESPIPSNTSATDINKTIVDEYVGDLKNIYFNTYSHLRKNTNSNEAFRDYVSGYAELRDGIDRNEFKYFGAIQNPENPSGDYTIGYVSVKPVSVGKDGVRKMHPFQKAVFEHIRVNRPELVHGNVVIQNGGALNNLISLALLKYAIYDEIAAGLTGFNRAAKEKGWGEFIQLNGKSIIKLQDPDGFKIGGGERVKRFTLQDNWTVESAAYGQEYDYTTEENGRVISSGVAYEPAIGKEESALTDFENYEGSTALQSSFNLMAEKPVLSSYYPAPSVGYSKVTVSSIAPEEADKKQDAVNSEPINGSDEILLSNNSAPISVYHFYTGKDFPVYCDITDLDPEPNMLRAIPIPGLAIDYRVKRAKSQGYSIVLNDMAGKLKSVESFKRKYVIDGTERVTVPGESITKTEYIYHTQETFSPNKENKLSSQVQVMTDDGKYQSAVMGQTVDIHIDRNENRTETEDWGINLNLEFGSLPGATYLPIPIPIPQYYHSEISHKSVVTNKVIHRSGILKETVVTTDLSEIKTENLAYDILTGQPLLTKVYNEFEDPIYAYSIPARMKYENMGAVYDRYDNGSGILQNSTAVSGEITLPAASSMVKAEDFKVGDEIFVFYDNGTSTTELKDVFVVNVDVANEKIKCINRNGDWITDGTPVQITMVRPVNRNLLASSVGSMSSMELTGYTDQLTTAPTNISFDKILNASAVRLSDEWQTDCMTCSDPKTINNNIGDDVNPYRNGIKGTWRAKSSYAYKSSRVYNQDTRTDGYYSDYYPFSWSGNIPQNWVKANEVTLVSPYGFELEEKDALDRYSAALYGYDNSLVTAVGANLRYNELAFDGFEDYPRTCQDDHFVFDFTTNTNAGLTDEEAHSGTYSVKVNPSSSTNNNYLAMTKNCQQYAPQFNTTTSDPYYQIDECDCIGKFGPTTNEVGSKYVISAWVKEDKQADSYQDATVNVSITGTTSGTTNLIFHPSGHIIEGWQRVYAEFDVPQDFTDISVKFVNGGSGVVFFDDLRLHPFDGNMVSYVYNPISLKLEAELDANNFATFYIYDEEGNLILVKKETERGVKTIQEGRVSINH